MPSLPQDEQAPKDTERAVMKAIERKLVGTLAWSMVVEEVIHTYLVEAIASIGCGIPIARVRNATRSVDICSCAAGAERLP